jgi:hypothetical protein
LSSPQHPRRPSPLANATKAVITSPQRNPDNYRPTRHVFPPPLDKTTTQYNTRESGDVDVDGTNLKSWFPTTLEHLIFIEKKIPLYLRTDYDSIYDSRPRDTNKIPFLGIKYYIGTYLFEHFKGLRSWVKMVHFFCDGWNNIKESSVSAETDFIKLSAKQISKLNVCLNEMIIPAKMRGILEVKEVNIKTQTFSSHEGDPETNDFISSHNDTFKIISNIILRPVNDKSILYNKCFFIINSYRLGEYEQDTRPLPKDHTIVSYDPVENFEFERPIVFSPWNISNDIDDETSKDANGDNTCTFCSENKANVAADPCGHVFMCSACKLIYKKDTIKKCTLCRQNIENLLTLKI